MTDYNSKFIEVFKQFITFVDNVKTTKDTKRIIENIDKLSIPKVQQKFFTKLKPYYEKIEKQDTSLFKQNLVPFPKIDLKPLWRACNTEQRNKLWLYLKMLYILSEINVAQSSITENDTSNSVDNMTNTTNESSSTTISKSFNPYEGVGENSSLTVGEVYKSVGDIEKPDENFTLKSLGKIIGKDKLKELDNLTEQLKNMNDDDIDNATKNIKGMLGNDVSEDTTKTLNTLMSSIASELKESNMKEGDIFESLSKIATSVANKMKPKLESGEINPQALLESTQKLSEKCSNGNPNLNPVNLVKMMEMFNKQKK